jgi:hypothetical protein
MFLNGKARIRSAQRNLKDPSKNMVDRKTGPVCWFGVRRKLLLNSDQSALPLRETT